MIGPADLFKKAGRERMYYPTYVKMPKDVYRKAMDVAASYYTLLKRRKEFEGKAQQTRINEWQIKAIEDAWKAAGDETERLFISKNVFEGVQMRHIALPMSQSSMKRVRKRFLLRLYKNLNLI